MHVLYVHKNFPAQFGHMAAPLVCDPGYSCTFVSVTPAQRTAGIEKIQYRPSSSGSREPHPLAADFNSAVAHAEGVYRTLKPLKDRVRPDPIVGHSGFGSTMLLPELYPQTPIINLFEFFYGSPNGHLGFRPDRPASAIGRLGKTEQSVRASGEAVTSRTAGHASCSQSLIASVCLASSA